MDITLVDNDIKDLTFDVKEGDTLNLNLAAFKGFPNSNIVVKVSANGHFKGAFADFSKGEGKFVLNVILEGDGSSCDWHLSSLAANQDKKVFDTSVTHLAKHTSAEMSNYGITMGESHLTFTGVSSITKGAIKTVTRQAAKIIVFDPLCDGRCSPVLKIDENDVDASHAAIVGRLNEDLLFYLQSRGISLPVAKRLITLGYLKPIESYFADQKLVAKIDGSIEEGI
jgi:Fe-S cluster assembly protein SufD